MNTSMDTTRTTAPTTGPLAVSLPALDRWVGFTDALADEALAAHLGTEDVVAALIDRSMVEEDLHAGAAFPDAALLRLVRADQHFRIAAAFILSQTDIALFKDDEPPTHWWWHVEQLVLGHAGEQLLAVPAAAALKDVHPHTIRAAIKDGRLPARRLARGFLVHRRDLERWHPRAVGRPRGSRSARVNDTLLESFNAANTAGEWQRATQLAEAMEHDPSTPRRCLAIALTAFNAGHDDKAEAWAARALEGDLAQASRQTALLVQGRALLRGGHPRKARRVLESARGLGYSDWLIDSALADAYLESGDARRAVEVARRAMGEAPDVPELEYLLARMLWHNDEPWDAHEHVIRFRTHRPDEPDGILLEGSILGYLGDQTHDARAHQRASQVVAPLVAAGVPEAMAIGGQALGSLGQWRPGLRLARALLRLPDESDFWRHRAWHVARAAVDGAAAIDAEEVAERAGSLFEGDVFFEQQLARVRAVRGDVDGTLDALHTSMEQIQEEDAPSQTIVALALLIANRGVEAYELLLPMADDLAEVQLPVLVDAAISAGDMEGALEAFVAFSRQAGNEGRIAALGLRLIRYALESAETVVDPRVANENGFAGMPYLAVVASRRHPSAPESAWEGLHRPTSAVMDNLTGRSVH